MNSPNLACERGGALSNESFWLREKESLGLDML